MDATTTPNLTETDDEIHVVELDDAGKPLEGAAPAVVTDAEELDDEAGDDDARLATSADESEEEIAKRTRSKRRREHRKRADQLARIEREQLHQTVSTLTQRLSQLEGHAVAVNGQTIDQRLNQKLGEIAQAEQIMAAAIAAGNGSDAVTASRLKDAAVQEAQQLRQAKAQIEQQVQRTQPQQTVQAAPATVDPAVINHAKEWAAQNPWYDHNGKDANSTMTRLIDADLVREGFNPATPEYWEELTARTTDELDVKPTRTPARRNAPPVGGGREHAPVSTRKEIRVTPERKAAMIENGSWDDPVRRQRVLKEYQEFDRRAASS